MSSLSHSVTTECAATVETAFAFLADASTLGSWALGCWEAELVEPGLVRGASLFDRSSTYVRVDSDRRLGTVDFAVGGDRDQLVHRISARVLSGQGLGYGASSCLVTLSAWRSAGMDDERWSRVVASHEAEILLLRGQIEATA